MPCQQVCWWQMTQKSRAKYQQFVCRGHRCKKQVRTYCSCMVGHWMYKDHHVQHMIEELNQHRRTTIYFNIIEKSIFEFSIITHNSIKLIYLNFIYNKKRNQNTFRLILLNLYKKRGQEGLAFLSSSSRWLILCHIMAFPSPFLLLAINHLQLKQYIIFYRNLLLSHRQF